MERFTIGCRSLGISKLEDLRSILGNESLLEYCDSWCHRALKLARGAPHSRYHQLNMSDVAPPLSGS